MAAPRKAETAVYLYTDERDKPPPARMVRKAHALADLLRLDERPKTARRYSSRAPLTLSDPYEVALWSGRDIRRPRSQSAAVWALRTKREVEAVLSGLRVTRPKRHTRWAYLDDADMLDPHGSPVVFAGRAAEGEPPSGIFATARRLVINCDDEFGLEVQYHVHCELIYVAPHARRRGVASSLVAAVAMCVQDDLDQLVGAWQRGRVQVPIKAFVSGDAYSRGGERAFEGIYSAIASFADMTPGIPITVEQDWSV